ncbi:MAG: hypothetical protein RSE32_07390 [Comamonas sp.]|uniref:hypothetical protein n=1 Tax=Comamonas sp. TaxID=34028 RepID=UPI002FC850F9
MEKFGWMIAVEGAPHLDAGADRYFTVNLVRPWCDEEDPAQPRGPEKDDASSKVGDLWSPSQWKPVEWSVYGRFDDAGVATWKRIVAADVHPGGDTLPLEDPGLVAKAIVDEVKVATAGSRFPLSQAIEDLQTRGRRSHVHMLAPLTHWPARLTGGVLQLTWFLRVPVTALADCDAVVCFPIFTMTAGGLVTGTDQEPGAGMPAHFADFNGKAGFFVDYEDNHVRFVSLAADPSIAVPALPADGLQLSQGSVSRGALLAALADRLLPLPVLRTWIDQSPPPEPLIWPDLQLSLVHALCASLGLGREYDAGESGRPNIVEFLVDQGSVADARVLRRAIEAGANAPRYVEALAAFVASVDQLAAAEPAADWALHQQHQWQRLKGALDSILKAKGSMPVADLITSWTQLQSVLSSEEGMREIMGVWLANILDGFFIQPHEKAAWAPVKQKLARVGTFRRDLLLRAQPYMGSLRQWDAARKLAQRPSDAALKQDLATATIAAVRAVFVTGAILPAGEIDPIVNKKLEGFVDELSTVSRPERPRPRDRGLKLDFTGWDNSVAPGSDQQIRGYAIGLCSGSKAKGSGEWKPDKDRARWLTDTAMRVNQTWARNADHSIAWMHEAVGATLANGERLVSVEYEGAPVATAVSSQGAMQYDGEDPDGFKAIDFAWHDVDRPLPLLGYGLYYAAKATPLDNAGAVIDRDLRGGRATELKEAWEVLAWLTPSCQYLSSEMPGAPDCTALPPEYQELSDETQAHAWQERAAAKALANAANDDTVRVPTVRKVTLLATDETIEVDKKKFVLFPKASRECNFRISAHGTHSAFIERWLATDRLFVRQGLAPSDPGLGSDDKAIEAFARTFLEKKEARTERTAPPYHPAVSAIGVELVIPGRTSETRVINIDRVRIEAGKLLAAEDKVSVRVVATLLSEPELTITGKSVRLDLPRGMFACLRFHALVAESHFTPGSSEQRYVEGLQNTSDVTFKDHRAFSPTELWFETAPQWPDEGLPEKEVEMTLTPPEESKDGATLSPNLLLANLSFGTAPKWAQWLKGAHVQRHEWHWTGYPVDFPSIGGNLNAWIPTLAGVESFREVIDIEFTTSFAGQEWRIGIDASGKAVVHRWALSASARPARYVAYLARPMLRFRRWLNPLLVNKGPLAIEGDIYAKGSAVPGRMREGPLERLSAPALRHCIPLTATYAQGHPFARSANGVMLVFNEAIRRTDDLANVGGLGDTLEVDLVETRFGGESEMGNNPIFHAAQPRDANLGLSVDRPLGLTFDIGPNPKVTQTAVVVRPENAGGRWVLAMARTRRLILPETELATTLLPDAVSTPEHLAVIPTRLDGKDVIPIDITVDVATPLAGPLTLMSHGATGEVSLSIDVPPSPQPDPKLTYRYLLSWHKARWHTKGQPDSEARWRCQVMLQARGEERLAWTTLGNPVRCSGNDGSQLEPGLPIERWLLVAGDPAARTRVRRLRISDYTEPRWLTFIGSFGNPSPGMASDYQFASGGGKLGMLEVVPGRKAALPLLRSRNASLTCDQPTFHIALVFRPVQDVVRLTTEEGAGELVACYFVDSIRPPAFLMRHSKDSEPTNFAQCYVHILTLQRTTSMSAAEEAQLGNATTLPMLLECAFPEQGSTAKESTLRLVPEYLGPISIRA